MYIYLHKTNMNENIIVFHAAADGRINLSDSSFRFV